MGRKIAAGENTNPVLCNPILILVKKSLLSLLVISMG
jgi:hypothetical protein